MSISPQDEDTQCHNTMHRRTDVDWNSCSQCERMAEQNQGQPRRSSVHRVKDARQQGQARRQHWFGHVAALVAGTYKHKTNTTWYNLYIKCGFITNDRPVSTVSTQTTEVYIQYRHISHIHRVPNNNKNVCDSVWYFRCVESGYTCCFYRNNFTNAIT